MTLPMRLPSSASGESAIASSHVVQSLTVRLALRSAFGWHVPHQTTLIIRPRSGFYARSANAPRVFCATSDRSQPYPSATLEREHLELRGLLRQGRGA
jgi:hypothetical protein